MNTENILQTIQHMATTVQRLDDLTQCIGRLEERVDHSFHGAEDKIADLRERVARLEASREADRAHIETVLAPIQIEIERATLQPKSLPQ